MISCIWLFAWSLLLCAKIYGLGGATSAPTSEMRNKIHKWGTYKVLQRSFTFSLHLLPNAISSFYSSPQPLSIPYFPVSFSSFHSPTIFSFICTQSLALFIIYLIFAQLFAQTFCVLLIQGTMHENSRPH